MSNVIDFTPPAKVQSKCSFCGKTEHQVRRLVSNNQTGKAEKAICDECIEKSLELMKVNPCPQTTPP